MFNNFFKKNLFLFTLVLITISDDNYARANEIENTIPLKESAWVTLAYNKIPSNNVTFSNNVLSVKVKHSAGPIVHKLDKMQKVVEIFFKGKMSGTKTKENGPFDEDSVLRFGLVATGNQILSGPKKWFAVDWVKKLFALAPEGTGLDKIYFFNLTNRDELLGKSRIHPKSDLIVENIIAKTNLDGSFDVRKKIEPPMEVAAVWISIDGDETKSEYETVISEIKIKEER